MTRRAPLTPDEILIVVTLTEMDYTHDRIAGLLGCNRSTVGDVLARSRAKAKQFVREAATPATSATP